MDKIILASGSPRRSQLLEAAHIPFEVIVADVDETNPHGMPGHEVPVHLAHKKATEVSRQHSGRLVLAADTVVLLDDDILGKPKDEAGAKAMLARLSGRIHEVVTGVCLMQDDRADVFSVVTEVYFRHLTTEQISFYVDTYKPMDKAGSYAIQEYIGMIGIEKINGDYYNVMGLPIGDVVKRLTN